MISYLDIMQQNLKELNQASKVNLIESNRKWFQFSKEILQLAKKAVKGQSEKSTLERLEKYEKFFGCNIEELIYSSADISLFEKNSYTEDISIVPDQGKKQNVNPNQNANQQALCQIDTVKVLNLFFKADK